MYYHNRIERKAKCRIVQKRINSTIKKMKDKTLQIFALDNNFYEELLKNINLGLQIVGEIRYYKNSEKVGVASIKAELSDFHLHKSKDCILTESYFNGTFDRIVELIESHFYNDEKYEVIKGFDETHGVYFEIKLR